MVLPQSRVELFASGSTSDSTEVLRTFRVPSLVSTWSTVVIRKVLKCLCHGLCYSWSYSKNKFKLNSCSQIYCKLYMQLYFRQVCNYHHETRVFFRVREKLPARRHTSADVTVLVTYNCSQCLTCFLLLFKVT